VLIFSWCDCKQYYLSWLNLLLYEICENCILHLLIIRAPLVYFVLEVFVLLEGCPNRWYSFFLYSANVLFHWHTHCTCSTVRRWRNGNAVEVWEAHKVAVQTVLKLPTGELFTGKTSAILFFAFSFYCVLNSLCIGRFYLLSCWYGVNLFFVYLAFDKWNFVKHCSFGTKIIMEVEFA